MSIEEKVILTPQLNEAIFKKALTAFFQGKSRQQVPQAILLGGQPGSGKSLLVEEAGKEFGKNVLYVSADDLRAFHPAYNELRTDPLTRANAANLVSPYANQWTEGIIGTAIHNKVSLIIDSTLGGKVESYYQTLDKLKEQGYQTHLRVMGVNGKVSKLGIFERYETQLQQEGTGRWTRMEDHNDRYRKIPIVMEDLLKKYDFASIVLFKHKIEQAGDRLINKKTEPFYQNSKTTGSVEWQKPLFNAEGKCLPVHELTRERERKPSPLERLYFQLKTDRIAGMIRERGDEKQLLSFLKEIHPEPQLKKPTFKLKL